MAEARPLPRCARCRAELPLVHPEETLLSKRHPHFPFCSDRCRLIDLGQWFEGRYVIPGDAAASEGHPEEGEPRSP